MAAMGGRVGSMGQLSAVVKRGDGRIENLRQISDVVRASLIWKIGNFRQNVWPGLWRSTLAKTLGMAHWRSKLNLRLKRADGSIVDYGMVSTRLVTTAFVNYLTDQLQAETSKLGDFKYHDSGVGVTGAATGDTDIETTDSIARAAGTQTEGTAGNMYVSVGTITYTASLAVIEHGLFNATTGATLLDHHVFSAINVVATDKIEFTYQLTSSAGG